MFEDIKGEIRTVYRWCFCLLGV